MKEKHPCLEIRWMCDRLNVSPSGYYSYLKATKRPADRQELDDMDLIRWAYDFKGRAKGARQIKMTIRHEKDNESQENPAPYEEDGAFLPHKEG